MAGMPNPAWGLWLLVLACLLSFGDAQTSGSTFNVQGYSPDQAALIKVKRAIPNWNLYQQRSTCFGWVEQPVDTVCQWTSVKCNAEGRVTTLHFQTNASFHLGSIENVMAAAQELSELECLNVAGQAFSGTLPTQYTFPKLLELDVSDNNIGGTIPELWGIYGNFPKLLNLSLAFNPPLSGGLPAGWGSDNSSLTSLQKFSANNCNLTGPLPGEWAAQLPALTDLNISSNALTGTLPANWTNMKNLRNLNMDRNDLTGTIPASWGMSGAFSYLERLSLFANQLTGSIPAAWAGSKNPFSGTMPRPAFPSLQWMDVANNLLGGRVPEFGNAPSTSRSPYFIANGNNFCGSVPASLSVWDCTSTCQKPAGWPACSANGTSPPLPPAPQTPTIAQATSSDMAVLLTLTKVIPNWDIFARTQSLNWTSTTTMCQSWQGVQCQGPYVIGLNFSEPDPGEPDRPPILQGVDNVTVHGSMPIVLQGDIGQVLTILQRLPKLATLDFTNAYLSGSIPSNLTFPTLQTLLLSSNNIIGTMPADWANQSAVPQLKFLDFGYNYQISGQIPDAWGDGDGLQSLTKLSFHSCNLTGTLPVSWVEGLPVLSALDLAYNYMTGTLPVQWANMSALQTLSIVGNGITGTLPDGWGRGGPNSWSALSELHLDANHLQGTLPMSWGATGAFPQILNVTLANNELAGSIPNNWGTDQNLRSPFPNLKTITLLPQQVTSAGLCGSIPSGLNVQQKMDGVYSRVTYLKPCSVSAATVQVQAKASQSAAGTNIGAIAGGIVGGVAGLIVLTAVVAFFVLRQRRRNRAGAPLFSKAMSGEEKLQYDPYDMDIGLHDSDNIIPPKSTAAPASIVPFAQAPSSMGSSQGAPRSGSLHNKRASLGVRDGSLPKDASFASQGSGYSSEPAREGDAKPETLPHMFNKDWELNLDALEIELDEDRNEVELGKGAFGVVVKGRYRLSPVAVKRLINQTPEQQAQFLKEMAILRACRGSRYIVPFVGASLQPGNTILAMDFMENGNLWDQLPRTNKAGQHIFQWKFRGKKVAYEIALGLHCLHDLKVVHLDLKSSNVLIAADGSAKISDVGLAALMSQNYLSQMAPAGTWSWVAPEVILGGKVTNKADIYSFGVVIWEICTLERPAWRGMLRDIRVPEEAPQEIADLVVRCTGDPEIRPSAQELAELLAGHLPMAGARRASSRVMSSESSRSPKSPAAGQPTSPMGPAPQSSGAGQPPVSGTAKHLRVPGGAAPKSPFDGNSIGSGTGQPTSAEAAPKSSGSNLPGSANGAV